MIGGTTKSAPAGSGVRGRSRLHPLQQTQSELFRSGSSRSRPGGLIRFFGRTREYLLAAGQRYRTRIGQIRAILRLRTGHRHNISLFKRVARPALAHQAIGAAQLQFPVGGLPGVEAGRPASLHVNGILRVAEGSVASGRIIRDRAGLRATLLKGDKR